MSLLFAQKMISEAADSQEESKALSMEVLDVTIPEQLVSGRLSGLKKYQKIILNLYKFIQMWKIRG